MKKRFSCLLALYDLVIDFALIGIGYLIYYQFNIRPLAPVDWNPIVIQFFTSKQLATLILSGVPFIVGVFSLARNVHRMLIVLKPRSIKV